MTAVAIDVRRSVQAAVWRALGTVRDPELDEPITDLAFVGEVTVSPTPEATSGYDVLVRLRLPTYFCAPNFAYLMVADARDAVAALTGVRRAMVRLDDHFASEEINAGVGGVGDFASAFPEQTDSADLEALRRTFQRKAYLAALERVCARLVADGADAERLTATRLGEARHLDGYAGLLRRRGDLGLPSGPGEWLFVDEDGVRIAADDAVVRLRFAKSVRVSIEGNGIFCRGLLRTRYGAGGRADEPVGSNG